MRGPRNVLRARSAASPGGTMRAWPLWGGYGAVVSVLIVVYFLLRNGSDAQLAVYQVVGLGGPIAILVGLRLYRPSSSRHWLFFAAGLVLWVVGDAYWDAYRWILGVQAPYPSYADGAYLGGYAMLVVGAFVRLPSSRSSSPASSAPRPRWGHGGEITVESAESKGATFCVAMPRPAAF